MRYHFVLAVIFVGLFIKNSTAAPVSESSVQHHANKIEIQNNTFFINQGAGSEIATFTAKELGYFLQQTKEMHPANNSAESRWCFFLKIDPNLPAFSFGVKVQKSADQYHVSLKGYDQTCILHAMYTFLERIGYRFEITGPIVPQKMELQQVSDLNEVIKPLVRERGIRQHVNFPMDISSYPLDEAKEYVHNLARMRFNYLTIHSYPNQWVLSCPPETAGSVEPFLKSDKNLAGKFFYGQQHDIPDVALLTKNIRNKKIFCIPSIEPYYDQPQERSALAIGWMQQLIKEAKRAGLTVKFSFEPRQRKKDITNSVSLVNWIVDTYPEIDVLEIMTQETGRWDPAVSAEELKKVAEYHFGSDIIKEKQFAALSKENQGSLDWLIAEIGHNLILAKYMTQSWHRPNKPRVSLGLYCVEPDYLGPCFELMRRFAPRDAEFALMPGHGSRRVAKFIEFAAMTRQDWQRTMIYSWVEFDGLMYLQQNCVAGIDQLLKKAVTDGGDSIKGICFNHWRNAENQTTAKYAALATLTGELDENKFYRLYASSRGIGEVNDYVKAMTRLDEADFRSTEELPNIGFCVYGCWGDTGLGYFKIWDPKKIESIRQEYQTVNDLLGKCLENSKSDVGRNYLAFLRNRLACTTTYLDAMRKGSELQLVIGNKLPENRGEYDPKAVDRICGETRALLDNYMARHAEYMVDRGCEGTLISLYHTPPAVLKRIQMQYGTSGTKVESTIKDDNPDEPASPIKANEKK